MLHCILIGIVDDDVDFLSHKLNVCVDNNGADIKKRVIHRKLSTENFSCSSTGDCQSSSMNHIHGILFMSMFPENVYYSA